MRMLEKMRMLLSRRQEKKSLILDEQDPILILFTNYNQNFSLQKPNVKGYTKRILLIYRSEKTASKELQLGDLRSYQPYSVLCK